MALLTLRTNPPPLCILMEKISETGKKTQKHATSLDRTEQGTDFSNFSVWGLCCVCVCVCVRMCVCVRVWVRV